MSLTLKEALTMHPLDKATIIAGHGGVDNPVSLFGILDAPDSFKFVRSGEFVVTSGYIFRDNPGLADTIVNELHQRKAAGLGIKLNRYITTLSPEALAYANENNFPIVSLPNEYSWHEISSPILINCLVDKKNIGTDILNVLNEYSDKVLKVTSLVEILKLLYQLTNMPCSLCGVINRSNIIHYPANFKPTQDVREIIRKSATDVHQILSPQSNIVVVLQDDPPGSRVIVANIKHWGDYSTYLLIWVDDAAFTNEQLIILQYTVNSIRLRFNELSSPRKELFKEQNAFLFRLLFEDFQSHDLISSQSNQLGITLSSEYVVAVAEISSKPAPACIEASIHSELEDFFYKARSNELNVLGGFGKFGELFFLIPVCSLNRTTDSAKFTRTKVASLKNGLEKLFPNMIFSFGIGKYHQKLTGLKSSFQEAVNSLKLGTKVFGYGSITHYNDLGVYRLLINPTIQLELKAYLNDYLIPLIEYDRQNKSDLVKTLTIFLETGRSNRQCAQKMFVHHNTIRYRLEQIEQICNLEFNNPNDLLILELALKAMTLIDEG